MSRLDCVKDSVKVWVLSKIRTTARKMYFCKKFDFLANNSSFLRIDHTEDQGNIILAVAVEVCEFLTKSANSFLLDVTFKNWGNSLCFVAYTYISEAHHMKTIYIRLRLHFYRIKKKKTCHFLLILLTIWCSFCSLKIIKVDFEAAVLSAINSLSGLSYYWL